MNESPTLDKLVVVGSRFARSVSLARDAHRSDALDGYIFTPTGRDVLRRLADALCGNSTTRAWSLTGPYGSGKSAFALFAAQLLCGEHGVRQQARKLLTSADEGLSDRFFGPGGSLPKKVGRLCPVLVTGSRQPMERVLAAALAVSLRAVAHRGGLRKSSSSWNAWPVRKPLAARLWSASSRKRTNTWGGSATTLPASC